MAFPHLYSGMGSTFFPGAVGVSGNVHTSFIQLSNNGQGKNPVPNPDVGKIKNEKVMKLIITFIVFQLSSGHLQTPSTKFIGHSV